MDKQIQMCDIGLNFTDDQFSGIYRDKQRHPDDKDIVLQRAFDVGVSKIIITAGNLEETKTALQLAHRDSRLYSTVGIHPTRCSEFPEEQADSIISELIAIGKKGKEEKKIVAVGEFGLDYDRLYFCDQERQNKYFRKQFEIVRALDLPLFLHERNCGEDFIKVFNEQDPNHSLRGCIHSYTGTKELAKQFLDMGFYIGFNGSGMRTEESLDVIRSVPLNRILIETDGPYCSITSAHASYQYVKTHFNSKRVEKYDSSCLVKGRNEPCCVIQVLEVIAACHGVSVEEAAKTIYHNTLELYFPWELELTQRRVTEITTQLETIQGSVNESNFQPFAKSLSDLDGELSSDLGPKIDKMYQKACETNPEKQTYGPETCEKIKEMYKSYEIMLELFKNVKQKCSVFVCQAEKKHQEEEQIRLEEQRRLEEETRKKQEEEERLRREEAIRQEQEKLRLENEEKERRRKEEEEKRAEEQQRLEREQARKRFEEEEQKRRQQAILDRQKAIAETLRLRKEAEKKAKEEEERKKREAEEAMRQAELQLLENKWNALINTEIEELETIELQQPLVELKGIRLTESGVSICVDDDVDDVDDDVDDVDDDDDVDVDDVVVVVDDDDDDDVVVDVDIWELTNITDFESFLEDPNNEGFCVYWHNDHFDRSKEILDSIKSILPDCPLHIIVINTSQYPQLLYRHNTKMISLQYYEHGKVIHTSYTETILSDLQQYIQSYYYSYYQYPLEKATSAMEIEESGIQSIETVMKDAIQGDYFGRITITADMKSLISQTIEGISTECKDVNQYKACIDMLKMVIGNIINHPNEMKYCKIKKDNVKLQERILKVDSGMKLLYFSGFKDAEMNGVTYILLKTENLNIPWLSYIKQCLEKVRYDSYMQVNPSLTQLPQSVQYNNGMNMMDPNGAVRLPGVDDGLLAYFEQMSNEEIMGEFENVMMQLMNDPDVAVAFQYLNEHPNDIMGAASDPTVRAGIQKLAANPTFCTLQYLLNKRMPH